MTDYMATNTKQTPSMTINYYSSKFYY